MYIQGFKRVFRYWAADGLIRSYLVQASSFGINKRHSIENTVDEIVMVLHSDRR